MTAPLRILFFLRAKNFDRLVEAVLDELLCRGHHIHVAFEIEKTPEMANSRFADSSVFDALAARHDGRLTYDMAPTEADAVAAVLGRQLRLMADYLRFLKPEYAGAHALRGRARKRSWSGLVALAEHAPARRPRGRPLLERRLRALLRAVPPDPATRAFIARRAPDLVVVSPLVELGSTQQRHVGAARAVGVPSAVLVASWDNLTTKGLILEAPDLVTVWNARQIEEATGLHAIPLERVVATGAPPYDQWFTFRPSSSAQAFRRRVGLDPDRPYILYACSSRFIARDENEFIVEWLEHLRASRHPVLRDVGVLVRPHPANWQIWQDFDLGEPGRVAVHPPSGEVPRQDASKAEYFDSIHHSSAVTGINTSAIVETAIIGRPAFTVLTDRYRPTQDGTLHFEHVEARHGGPLSVAHTFDEHFAQLAQALEEEPPVERLRGFVERFVRPHGLDQPAAPRVAGELEALVDRTRPAAPPAEPAPDARPRRILWVLDHPGLLMHFDATLAALAGRGHALTVAFARPQRHAAALTAIEPAWVDPQPVPRRRGPSALAATQLRAGLDALHYLAPAFADATFARRRWAAGLATPVWIRALAPLLRGSPTAREVVRERLEHAEDSLPVDPGVDAWLAARAPDLVVVSPMVQRDARQADVVAAARARGIPTVLAVASWDNLSSKGTLRELPDHVTVWNERQREEASVLHRVPPLRITITGAQPFDRWFDRQPGTDRQAFCATMGLPGDRPFVLWAGSTKQYRPDRDEIDFVRRWVAALHESQDPAIRGLAVLVRPHPTTIDAWADVEIEGATVWRRRTALPIAADERGAYFDALHHAAAVVGINSSAMVEAAIVGRPVHSIRRPEWTFMQDALMHFRYLLPENGGFLRMASSLEEHARLLADDLRSPTAWRPAQERFVAEFVRPFGLDQPATPRLVAALEAFAAGGAPARPPADGARTLHALLTAAGGGRVAAAGLARTGSAVTPQGIRRRAAARASASARGLA